MRGRTTVTVRLNLRVLAHLISYSALAASVGLVLAGYSWCVVAVAISGYTLGLLSGVTWFLDPWMDALASRDRRRPR